MSKESPESPDTRVGLVRLRQHCTFRWSHPPDAKQRRLHVQPSHCAPCVEEGRRLGYRLIFSDDQQVS